MNSKNVASSIVEIEEITSPGTTESHSSEEGKSINDEIRNSKYKCFDETRTLWVGDVPFDAYESDIASVFSNFGEVEVSLKIGSLKYPTKYAFIQFSSIEIALDVMKTMNNQVVLLNCNKDKFKFELKLGLYIYFIYLHQIIIIIIYIYYLYIYLKVFVKEIQLFILET
jgi:RNA recognition motif-containing protein